MCLDRRAIQSGPIITIVSIALFHLEMELIVCVTLVNSVLFTREQRSAVLMSNLGILFMGFVLKWGCSRWGTSTVVKYYAMPWICVNHWFVMITYLQHTDPALPHYRSGQWNFQRGAAATMDREFLGFIGHFFLHDVAHFHVIHHFFPKMPFCL